MSLGFSSKVSESISPGDKFLASKARLTALQRYVQADFDESDLDIRR